MKQSYTHKILSNSSSPSTHISPMIHMIPRFTWAAGAYLALLCPQCPPRLRSRWVWRQSAGALELGMWVPETGEMSDNSIVGYMWQPGNYDWWCWWLYGDMMRVSSWYQIQYCDIASGLYQQGGIAQILLLLKGKWCSKPPEFWGIPCCQANTYDPDHNWSSLVIPGHDWWIILLAIAVGNGFLTPLRGLLSYCSSEMRIRIYTSTGDVIFVEDPCFVGRYPHIKLDKHAIGLSWYTCSNTWGYLSLHQAKGCHQLLEGML